MSHTLFSNLNNRDVMFHEDLVATLILKLSFSETHDIFMLNPWLV